MYVVEPSISARSPSGDAVLETGVPGSWAQQTRRVLTRDLLARAARAEPGEARALEFRALHLNLPLVSEVAARLGLSGAQLAGAEHLALDGLLEAVHAYDPFGTQEFADIASAFVERRLRQRRGV